MLACTAYTACMQYTIRNLPASVDRALRERARREGKSLNEATIDALLRAFGLDRGEPPPIRDLRSFAGSWVEDRAQTRALAAQRRIDRELWQ